MKKIILTGLMTLLVIFAVGCTTETTTPQVVTPQTIAATDEFKTFSSAEEVKEYLDAQQKNNANIGFGGGIPRMAMAVDGIAADFAVAESAPVAAKSTSAQSSGASDFSQTNVQVQGVDEADIVKNDGKYIYTIANNQLTIVDAFPAENAEIVSIVPVQGQPQQLFVSEDTLVVFATDSEEVMKISPYDFVPQPRHTTITHVYLYDIENRAKPQLIEDYTLNGWYQQSRMIGDTVYVIAQENVYYYNNIIDLPVIRASDSIIAEPPIRYFDNPEDNYVFHTVMALDINSQQVAAESFMMGHSNTIYMSQDNLYITYRKNQPYYWYRTYNLDRFYEAVLPLLPVHVQTEAKALPKDEQTAEKIASILENMYNNMDEKQKQTLIEDIQNAVNEYDVKKEVERAKTIIHKIAVDGTTIDYKTRGEVPGYLLNQFSLDEHNNKLRVATTFNIWANGERVLYNNVYVLDEDLETVGELEDIAPDERIYSTRFIGDRLYMVTFKQIDPFFVIDLSTDTPKILGELKIPGFSDYLHPYDENHIIGLGKETEANQWGGVSTSGVKLALFDVSDVSNPKEVDKVEIGQRGSDSEASRDHKAFLFDKEKNLLVIPVREVTGRQKDPRFNYFRNTVWQGAYVFGITPESGFEEKGKITHQENVNDRDYWRYNDAVRRSLYMDDVLYTISSTKIKMSDLETIQKINEIELPSEQSQKRIGIPEPIPLIAVEEEAIAVVIE